ncbi:cation:dicarboxylase symporter family transporter [Streptomyces sp. NBC_01373]|uniref:cation:dicarboxylate symporter family transporter n=1 Tax=Streptomyces sp. NBC_01373 TaxID=2903843 RepID=UPI002B1DEF58|nr:cation:dicarboxylase symporter family transporter [Streptomyces sp. NBC_01373]
MTTATVLVVLGAIMRACRLSLFGLMRFLKAELLVALSTCSSEAVLPQLVRKLEILGIGRPVVGIVIPSGFSFNLDGSAVYLTMASLFLAQAMGIDLSWQQQLIMVGVMMLTSKGTAGIAGGAFIVLASTVTAVGHIPLAALSLIVGIDRILNEGRVFINVLGNAVATIVIGKWENDFDTEQARKVLHSRTTTPPAPTSKSPPSTSSGDADRLERSLPEILDEVPEPGVHRTDGHSGRRFRGPCRLPLAWTRSEAAPRPRRR